MMKNYRCKKGNEKFPTGLHHRSEANLHMGGRVVLCGIYVCFAALLIMFIVPVSLHAQTIEIRGFITDGSSGRPLENSNIVVRKIPEGDIRGAAADRYGYYYISGLPPGQYLLRITYLGYEVYQDTLTLVELPRVTINAALQPEDELMEEIEVVGYAETGIVRRSVGVQRITTSEIRRVPTPAGSGDLAGYLATLPGVVTPGDRGGQFFIRGGTPSQNMVLVDGALIYQPFHIAGFFSAFPEDLVSGADFYAGGFGSRYSGRLSSVVDVQMREGHRYNNRGSVSLGPFAAGVVVEGPFEEGVSSWISSVRRSIIEHTSPLFLSEKEPLRFESHYFKFSHSEEEMRCSASLLHTYDRGRMDLESEDVVRWGNVVFGGRCLFLPEGSDNFRELNLSISHLGNTMNVGHSELFSKVLRSSIDVHTIRMLGGIRIDYGAFILFKFLNYVMRDLFFTPQSDDIFFSGVGLYLDAELPVGRKISVQPGGVFTFYPGMYPPGLEPRFRASWKPFGRDEEELSIALGWYRQFLAGVSDRRDAGSVFTGWMLSPVGEKPKEAIHALAGWGQSLGGGFRWSVEGFYKWIRNQPVPIWGTQARFTSELSMAKGYVYGGDVRFDYSRGPFYGSAGYGYTFTEYRSAQDHFNLWFGEPVQRFHPPHDRRHQINARAGLELERYAINVSWQMGSGLPFTRPMGFDEYIRYGHGLPNVQSDYEIPRMLIDRPYSARMPDYHRLDLSAERLFSFGNTGLRVQGGAVNVYNRTNMFFYDVFTRRRIDQLPFVPYLSMKLEVR